MSVMMKSPKSSLSESLSAFGEENDMINKKMGNFFKKIQKQFSDSKKLVFLNSRFPCLGAYFFISLLFFKKQILKKKSEPKNNLSSAKFESGDERDHRKPKSWQRS